MTTKHLQKAKLITSKLGTAWGVTKATFGVVVLATLVGSVIFTGVSVYKYINGHYFLWRSPVIFQAPLQIKEKKSYTLPSKLKTLDEGQRRGKKEGDNVTAGLSVDKLAEAFYDTVHLMESGRGKDTTGLNGYCISHGLGINEVGFAPHESYCFKNLQEQKEMVLLWLKNRLGTKCRTVEDCLSLYSNGGYNKLIASE